MRGRTGCRACSGGWASLSSRRRPSWSRAAPRRSAGSAAKWWPSSGNRMSRIGNAPISIPDGVTVTIEPARVAVAGPLGTLQQQVPTRTRIEQRDGEVVVTRPTERGEDRARPGLTRTLVEKLVYGVAQGGDKKLESQGVGYRAALKGTSLERSVGYSHRGTVK